MAIDYKDVEEPSWAIPDASIDLVTMNQRMSELARRGVPKEKVFDELKLSDLGWDHTVSTVAFKGGLSGYYDEMKALLAK